MISLPSYNGYCAAFLVLFFSRQLKDTHNRKYLQVFFWNNKQLARKYEYYFLFATFFIYNDWDTITYK